MPSLPRRVAAAALDIGIVVVPCMLLSMAHLALALLAAVLYGALFESSPRRATLGKYWCGLYVVTVEGAPVPFALAFVRNALKYGALFLAGLSYGATLVVLVAPYFVRKQRRGLHDLLAKTHVRREPRQGLSDVAVGLLSTVVPVLFVAGLLPILMNPAYEAAARGEITRVIEATHPQRAKIAVFHANTGRLPDTLDEAGIEPSPPELAAMTYRAGYMTLDLPRKDASAPAARLIFTAHPAGSGVTWTCLAEGIRKERLPAMCRD